jgi:opacity protein-like surface antigen
MKKLLSVCVLALTAGYVQAQTSAGGMMLSGGFAYESQKEETPGDDDKTSEFTFTPGFGYFVIDNLAVGLNLGLSTGKIEQDGDEYKTSGIVFEPFVRYYKFTSNEKFAFYAEGALAFGSNKIKPDGGDNVKLNTFEFRVSPGFSYFFNEHWAADLRLRGISYTSEDTGYESDYQRSTFVFGVDSFDPTISVRYYFGN